MNKKLIAFLINKGHTAQKALEIAIDVARNDKYAILWCKTLGWEK